MINKIRIKDKDNKFKRWRFLYENNLFFLFYFTILYWFCHTSTWICHGCTWVPNPEPRSVLPHTISLGHPSAPAPSILYPASNPDWRFISYMILYMKHEMDILRLKYTKAKCDNPILGLTAAYTLKKKKNS